MLPLENLIVGVGGAFEQLRVALRVSQDLFAVRLVMSTLTRSGQGGNYRARHANDNHSARARCQGNTHPEGESAGVQLGRSVKCGDAIGICTGRFLEEHAGYQDDSAHE